MTLQQVKQVQPGDMITWNDPDAGLCSRTDKVAAIAVADIDGETVEGDDVAVSITWDDGSELECYPHELSK